jgi:hypothetical protein
MPKAGGLTFRNHLEKIYGKKTVIHDYTPCGLPDYKNELVPSHILNKLRNPKKTTVLHGHFLMERYAHLPNLNYVAWMRNPVDRLISHYYYWLRGPDPNHQYCNDLMEKGLSITDFAELMPNMFAKRFAPLNIKDFHFIGITEQFNDSLKLFYAMYAPNKKPTFDIHNNRNFARSGDYSLNPKQRSKIEEINSKDMKLYKQAQKRFKLLQNKYGKGF